MYQSFLSTSPVGARCWNDKVNAVKMFWIKDTVIKIQNNINLVVVTYWTEGLPVFVQTKIWQSLIKHKIKTIGEQFGNEHQMCSLLFLEI